MKRPGALGTVCCLSGAHVLLVTASSSRVLPAPWGSPVSAACLSPCHPTRPVQSLAVSVGLRRSARLLSAPLCEAPVWPSCVVLSACLPSTRDLLTAPVCLCELLFQSLDWLPQLKGEGQRPRPCPVWPWPALLSCPGAALCHSHPPALRAHLSL